MLAAVSVMMTREDVLRELELLPLWTLRTPPVAPQSMAPAVAASSIAVSPTEPLALVETPAAAAPVIVLSAESVIETSAATAPSQALQHLLNDDGDCMFVLAAAELQTDEAVLLRNIIMAMALKTKAMPTPAYTAELVATQPPKLIIALGESTAQYLLQTARPLADLRGVVHAYQGVALVATYDLAHLLKNLPDKAQAWADFCLGLHTLQSLKSTD